MKQRILEHLGALVSCDTSKPAETMQVDDPIMQYAAEQLQAAGFTTEFQDLGQGRVNLVAKRGAPKLLLNCHLDTVPVDPKWTLDPFSLTEAGDKVHGLGSCDIKGAAACMLTAVEATDHDVAVLFNTDEEAGHGDCIEYFLTHTDWHPSAVVVAEPTEAKAVRRHRGFASFSAIFQGEAAHTSMANAAGHSAAHDAVRWSHAALALTEPGGILEHARFNIGILEGGVASNVVNSQMLVRFGFRPRPGDDGPEMAAALRACLPADASVEWTERFLAPPLDTSDEVAAFLTHTGLTEGDYVDFWTEAALFHQAGHPTIVLGPGNIAQAHQADECVAIDSLVQTAKAYTQTIEAGVPEVTHVA